MKPHRLALFMAALLGSIGLSWIIVPATVIPPAAPLSPITVHIAASGLHSRLVLPHGDRWVQYGFGDWNYYALNRQDVPHALMALLWPTQGALGWGEIASLTEFQAQLEQGGARLLSFQASSVQVNQLMRSLHTRLEQQSSKGHVDNQMTKLRLVPDGQTYSLLHNSNHELAEWLRALNCEVKSLFLWRRFRLAKAVQA